MLRANTFSSYPLTIDILRDLIFVYVRQIEAVLGSVHSLVGTGSMIRGSNSGRGKAWRRIKRVSKSFFPAFKTTGA
jgi:hypothetical protein